MGYRATSEEILDAYVAAYGERRVHRSSTVSFVGSPGNFYFVPRAPNDRQMARLTRSSGHAEITLTRINDTHIIHVGNRGFATGTLTVPRRDEDNGIEEFAWITHTHPREQENEYQMIARGPTPQDREVLRRVFERWQQRESTVIVCRAGEVENVVQFSID